MKLKLLTKIITSGKQSRILQAEAETEKPGESGEKKKNERKGDGEPAFCVYGGADIDPGPSSLQRNAHTATATHIKQRSMTISENLWLWL